MGEYHINEHHVLFNANNHQYIVDGREVISVTQLVDEMLDKPYKNVDPLILEKAAQKGQALHDMIEAYEKHGHKTMHVEMQSYLSLKNQHQIDVLENEKIVLLYVSGIPVAAGRFDMVVSSPYIHGLGISDVKRMAHLNIKRITLQLNLYKLGYEQTYKKRIDYLKCMHIRHRHHQYVDISINADLAKEALETYLEKHPIDYDSYP